jgi:hypothetical protein
MNYKHPIYIYKKKFNKLHLIFLCKPFGWSIFAWECWMINEVQRSVPCHTWIEMNEKMHVHFYYMIWSPLDDWNMGKIEKIVRDHAWLVVYVHQYTTFIKDG